MIEAGWSDEGTWRVWLGRLFIGYASDLRPQERRYVWRTTTSGDDFWSITLGRRTLALGWLSK